MTAYLFDGTMDGLLTAVFDAFSLKEQPEALLAEGDPLPLFCEHIYKVCTDEEKARRVWAGLEKRLSREAMKLISVSWLSELRELNEPLFLYICKVFRQGDIARNFADPDVLTVTNIARRVLHEQLRMKQFIRFQKAKDGTYLAVVSPDHNVLPIVIDHFQERFNDQPWLIYDAKRHYGYYSPTPAPAREGEGSHYTNGEISAEEVSTPLSSGRGAGGEAPIRITFEDEAAVPFNLRNGRLNDEVLSSDDQLLQDLWRTYFKAICIRERMNPRKQLKDMPRRYWKYMTEKNGNS
ncbi:MAG: TIGR03915 family putative DNA repair protein [Prevotella sp.]|nr:TIGR03915 family putative DNA repair protein [Prevotella sp.]